MSTIITTPARSSSTPAPSAAPRHRNVIARALGVIALGAVAWVHLADLSGKMSEVPYLGVMYIGRCLEGTPPQKNTSTEATKTGATATEVVKA